jgi:uncharacterized protein YjbI with pentapeptide repeats
MMKGTLHLWGCSAVRGLLNLLGPLTLVIATYAQSLPPLHSKQFEDDPSLVARRGQIVILDAPADDEDEPIVRYQLTKGEHEFCVNGGRASFGEIRIEDSFEQEVLRLNGSAPCAKATFPSGLYRICTQHKKHHPKPRRPGPIQFIDVDPPNPALTDATGDGIGGYWAVQPDPSNDRQQLGDGRLTTNPSFAPFGSYSPFNQFIGSQFPTYANFIQEEFGVTQMDRYSLFQFQYGNSSNLGAYYPSNNHLNRLLGDFGLRLGGRLGIGTCTCQNNCPIDNSGYPARYDAQGFCQTPTQGPSLVVQDMGHYQFGLQYRDSDGTIDYQLPEFGYCLVFDDSNNTCTVSLDTDFEADEDNAVIPTGPLHVVFRFFPDGNVPPLQDGEVALYEKCNYQGKAVVLGRSLANFLEWNSDVVTLDKLGASVQLGNNTAVTFYSEPNFAGSPQTETLNAACLASKIASIQVQSAASVLVSTRKCLNCSLEGADLSGLDLSGVDLTSADMKGARLAGTILSSATLRQTNLSGAKLYGATLDNANLEGANLQSAYLTNSPPDGIDQAASLNGAFLRNANLSFAQLSGANFTNASFYGTNGLGGSSGWSTCPVNNQGYTNGCATAHYAVMNNTVLSGAYLFGVDFTNTQATGAVFGNAVLVGANFDQAILGSDSTASTTTSLDSAFLQGANLATATLNHVSLGGAFVDFSPNGNTIDIRLPGAHTNFAGYWGQAGQAVCAEPGYSGPTTVPATNSTITCPDGKKYTNGCGATNLSDQNSPWNNKTDISSASTPASYQNAATYTPASVNPICADDPIWDVGGNLQSTAAKKSLRGNKHDTK